MKKIIKIVTSVILMFTLLACQSSEFSGRYALDSIIVGESVYQEDDQGWETILGASVPGKNIYIELHDNGTFSYVLLSDKKNGKWSKENDVITMISNGFEEKAKYKDGSLLFEKENNVSLLFIK